MELSVSGERWTFAQWLIVPTDTPIWAAQAHPNPRLPPHTHSPPPLPLPAVGAALPSFPPSLCNCTERGLVSCEAKQGLRPKW